MAAAPVTKKGALPFVLKIVISLGRTFSLNSIKNKNEQLEAIIEFANLCGEFKTADIEELLSIKSSRARLLISELVKIGKP